MSSGKSKRKHFFFYDFVKITAVIPAFIFIRYKTLYVNKAVKKNLCGKLLIVSNHSTYIDPVIIMKALYRRRIFFMATKDLFQNRLAAWFFRHVHCIEVDKENVSISTIKKVIEYLNDNRAVAIFPEGSVNEDADDTSLKVFKDGAALMAIKSGSPVLPVYIDKEKKVIVIGEKIEIPENADGAKLSGLKRINEFSNLLYEKELELKNLICDKF